MSSHEQAGPTHVSLAHYYPYQGIAHAGGQYVRRHLETVGSLTPAMAFVSSDRAHLKPHELDDPPVPTVVVERPSWGRWTTVRALRLMARKWDPTSVGFDVRGSFARSTAFREAVEAARSVEFQFFEECWAIGLV